MSGEHSTPAPGDVDAPPLHILVIEDEPSVAEFIREALVDEGYQATVAPSIGKAVHALLALTPDLVILDAMLPDGDGFDFLADMRLRSAVPVLMVTARDSLGDRVRGLDTGADDYLVKPFKLEELLARVRALLRRRPHQEERLILGDLEINFRQRRVSVEGRIVFLSVTEYAVLEVLARHRGQPVTKQTLLRHVWDDDQRDPNVVEVYVNYLRRKIERGGKKRYIHTIRPRGYALSEEPPE